MEASNPQSAIDRALSELDEGKEDLLEEQTRKRKRVEKSPEQEQEDYEREDILTLCSMDERRRFLVRQIHVLRNENPDAWERTTGFGNDPLANLTESQLRTILSVMKEECGISGPYDNAQSIASFFGNVLERNFGLQGLTKILSTDSDIITLIHENLPKQFQNIGGIAKLADKIIEVITAVYSKERGIKKPWIDIPKPKEVVLPSKEKVLEVELQSQCVVTEVEKAVTIEKPDKRKKK